MIISVTINGFSPNLVCALVLWKCSLGLLMGKFRQFWSYLLATYPYFSFWTTVSVSEKVSPNLICTLILWRSGLGLLIIKFHHIFSYLPARHDNGRV